MRIDRRSATASRIRSTVIGSVCGPCNNRPGTCPIASSAEKPVIRVNPWLTHSTRPSASVITTALLVLAATSDSTRVCSRSASRSAVRSATSRSSSPLRLRNCSSSCRSKRRADSDTLKSLRFAANFHVTTLSTTMNTASSRYTGQMYISSENP